MALPNIAYSLSGPVYGGTAVSAYTPMVQDSSGYYLPATAANRALYGRTKAIAISSYGGASSGVVQLQHIGPVDNGLNLGAGLPDRWCRANAAAALEVFTPTNGGTSDVVGKVDANGLVTLEPGVWTETMAYNAVNGGSSFTPPTGTGLMTVTGGVVDTASLAAGTAGNVPVSDGTRFASGALPIASTSGTLPVSRGGTGATTLASGGLLAGAGAGAVTSASITTDGTNLAMGSGYISVGATPAGVGTALRLPYAATDVIIGAKDSGGNDREILARVSANSYRIGPAAASSLDMALVGGLGSYWQIGSGGASTGLIRLKSGQAWSVLTIDDGIGGNRVGLLVVDPTTSSMSMGIAAFNTTVAGAALALTATGVIYNQVNGSNKLTLDASAAQFGIPLGGQSGANLPLRWGVSTITVVAGSQTLTAAQYANPYLVCSGTPASASTLVAPLSAGAMFIVTNASSQSMTFGGSSGSTVSIASGVTSLVVCDGTNYRKVA